MPSAFAIFASRPYVRLPVFDDPDTLAVQIDVGRARGGGINPGFGLALDEQPATGEQQLAAGLPNVVVELTRFLV